MNKYLAEEEIELSELKRAIRAATVNLQLVPILCGAALRNKGIQPLLDAITDYLPAPTDIPPVVGQIPGTSELDSRSATVKGPFSALAFKVQMDQGRKLTYVRIYSYTPTQVVVGYTPGYLGTVVTPAGVVVYGTGYVYPAYVGPTVWYGPPPTYGYGVNVTYTPWTGWTFGFMAVGAAWYAPPPYWGPMRPPYYYPYPRPMPYGAAVGPYGGAAAWGPGGWAATSGNVYSSWGSTSAVTRNSAGYNAWTGNAWATQSGRSYNSATGQISAGQRGAVQNVYTGNYASGSRGATYNPSTGVAAAGQKATVGNAYTGNEVTAGRGVVSGPGGNTTSVAGVQGSGGGSVYRVGDSYYGTKDGNVYRSNGQGGYEQVTPKGSGSSTLSSSQTRSLQQQEAARQQGTQRASSAYGGSSGWGGRSGSGSYGGSWGGGGGGRRR
jgi:hypothetical protein